MKARQFPTSSSIKNITSYYGIEPVWSLPVIRLRIWSAQTGTISLFIPLKDRMIADLIVDSDMEGLSKYYGSKKVKKSDKVIGAYEATDYFENIGGQSRYMYFLASPIYDEEGKIIAAIETLQDVSREREMTKSMSEYAETLQNELIENIELRRQIEDLYNYLQSIINSLPDKIYEIDENGIITYMSLGLRKGGGIHHREIKRETLFGFCYARIRKLRHVQMGSCKKRCLRPL